MANSTMDTLRGLLGDNADEKIKAALSSLSGTVQPPQQVSTNSEETSSIPVSSTSTVTPDLDSGTLESIMQIRGLIEGMTNSSNDSRSNLLMSLRPFMRTSRQSSIDTAVRLLNISKLSGLFKLR